MICEEVSWVHPVAWTHVSRRRIAMETDRDEERRLTGGPSGYAPGPLCGMGGRLLFHPIFEIVLIVSHARFRLGCAQCSYDSFHAGELSGATRDCSGCGRSELTGTN